MLSSRIVTFKGITVALGLLLSSICVAQDYVLPERDEGVKPREEARSKDRSGSDRNA